MAARIIDRRNYDTNIVEKDQYNRTVSDCIIYESGEWFGIFQEYDESGRIRRFESASLSKDYENEAYHSEAREYFYYSDGSGRTVKNTVKRKYWNDNEPVEENINSHWFDEVLTNDGEYIPEAEADL